MLSARTANDLRTIADYLDKYGLPYNDFDLRAVIGLTVNIVSYTCDVIISADERERISEEVERLLGKSNALR